MELNRLLRPSHNPYASYCLGHSALTFVRIFFV